MNRPRAIVTSADKRSALSVVRSLGRAGISSHCLSFYETAVGFRSRYCSGQTVVRPLSETTDDFTQKLDRIIDCGGFELLVPVSDQELLHVSENRERWAGKVGIPIPAHEAICQALDKRRMLALAGESGVPAPEVYERADGETLEQFAARAPYPVVIKPRTSAHRVGDRIVSTPVAYARDAAEFLQKWRAAEAVVPDPMAMEFLPGAGYGVFALYWKGERLASFGHRRLREASWLGGASSLRESVRIPEMDELACRLLSRMNWHGVAMVEFLRDARDNRFKLMEVNPRFWGSLALALHCGMDMPRWLYELETGKTPAICDVYPEGRKCRWFLGDVHHLLTVAKQDGRGLPIKRPSLARTAAAVLNPLAAAMPHDYAALDDPGPALALAGAFLKNAAKGKLIVE